MATPVEAAGPPRVGEAPARAPVVLRDHRPGVLELLRDTWRHRALVPRLGIRVIIKGVSGTILGRGWLVLRPVMSIFAMALLFGAVLDAPSQGVPYIVFLLAGMLGWLPFERLILWSTRSFDVYRRVRASFDFPLLVVPFAAFIPAGIEVGIVACLTALTVAYFALTDGTVYVQFGPQLALVPLGFGLAVAFAWGLGLILGPLNARARDVRLTLRYVVMVWLYVTPVLYPKSSLPGGWGFLATINPMAAPVGLVKEGLVGAKSVEAGALVVSVVGTLLVCAVGLWFFSRAAPTLVRDRFPIDDEEEENI